MRGRITVIEVSLVSAIFILFALGYSTYLTMQEATHTQEAAAMMRSLQSAGIAWVKASPTPSAEGLTAAVLSKEPRAAWGEAVTALSIDGDLALRLCAPDNDVAYALSAALRVKNPRPPSTCVVVPIGR